MLRRCLPVLLALTPTLAAAGPDAPDASHVKKGQVYHFRPRVIDNATMRLTMTSQWKIKAVAPAAVTYQMVSTTTLVMKNPNIPPQKPRTSTFTNKYPLKVDPALAKPEPNPLKPIKEETLTVSGMKFPCKVYKTAGMLNWVSNKFPGLLKSEKDGKVVYELVKIDGLAKPTSKPATPTTTPRAKPVKQQGPDASHVRKGQKYHFKPRVIDNATMRMELRSHWEITKITPQAVHYEMVTTTNLAFKNPNIPPQKPKTIRTSAKYPLTVRALAAPKAVDAPQPIKEETVNVSGVEFPCKVYEINGIKSWTSIKFPGLIKSLDPQGKALHVLIKIDGAVKGGTALKSSPRSKPAKKATAQPAKKPGGGISHVKLGQRYVFKGETDTKTMTIETTFKYIVRDIRATEIVYDMETTSHVVFKNNPNMPPMKPNTHTTRGLKMPIGRSTRLPGLAGGSKQTGTDTLTIDGVKFECTIYETKSAGASMKYWLSDKYPYSIIVERNGQPLMRLTKIEQP